MIETKIKVLIVEDDKADQMALKRFIRQEHLPFDFTLAGTVAEALNLLKTEQYEVIISDYSLGAGTAIEILNLKLDTPVIITTGTGGEEIAVRAMKAGAYDYLIKDPDYHYLKVLPLTVKNSILRKKIDRQFRLLSSAIMSINDSVFITDMADQIIFINNAFSATYEYREEDILGKSSLQLWQEHPDLKDKSSNLEGFSVHKRKSGVLFPVSFSRSPIKNEQDHETAVIYVVRDITEQKAAEEALRASEEKYKALFDNSLAGIVIMDFQGKILMANQAAARMFEADNLEQTIGMNSLDIVHPDDRQRVILDLKKVQEGHGGFLQSYRVYTQKGRALWVETLGTRINYQGTPADILAIRDITQSKMMEEELQKNEAKYRSMFENTGTATIIIEESDIISLANKEFEKLSAFSKDEIENKMKWQDFVFKDDFEKMTEYRRVQKADPVSAPDKYDFRIMDKFGHIKDVLVTKSVIPGTKKIMESMIDITERKKLERVKDEFLSTVSHELRTPLTIIKEAVSNLQDGIAGGMTEEQIKIIEITVRNTNRLSRLINDILDLSRLESGKAQISPVCIEPLKLIKESVQNFYPIAKNRNLVINFEAPPSLQPLYADEIMIGRIINNLLDNAIRFAQKRIVIEARNVNKENCPKEPYQYLQISITDDGPGLEKENFGLLFNKFQQFQRPMGSGYKGTGLGLAISKEIVELHQGKIWVESTRGQGAKFQFLIPLTPPKPLQETRKQK